MLDYQRQRDMQKARTEDAKRNKLRSEIIKKQQESLAEKDYIRKLDRDQKAAQSIHYREIA